MSSQARLPPEVNRILFVRNLPFKISSEEMYDLFGKYGSIRQIRIGNASTTRGTAFVVYDDIYDAKNACDHLSGFNLMGRYLIVIYHNAARAALAADQRKLNEKRKAELDQVKAKYGIPTSSR